MVDIGKWAFIVGVILALVAGAIPSLMSNSIVTWVLVVLGLIVGFLNVTDKESTPFLVATVALMMVGTGGIQVFGSITSVLESMLTNIVIFTVPGALVVALKSVYSISKN